MRKFTVCIDIDDTLMPYMSMLCKRLHELYGIEMVPEDFKEWGFDHLPVGLREKIHAIVDRGDVLDLQYPWDGAQNLVSELMRRGHKVIVATATSPALTAKRAEQLHLFFPAITDIMFGNRKDLLEADFLLDDSDRNVRFSHAKHPCLFRRPHNSKVDAAMAKREGFRIVETYEEFLAYVDAEAAVPEKQICCLVGPSASGKTSIADLLCDGPASCFAKVRTSTTRAPRPGEAPDAYNFYASKADFVSAVEKGLFLEQTIYAGEYYGTEKAEVDAVIGSGKKAVIVVDSIGAQMMKERYGDAVCIIYVFRPRATLEAEILRRPVSEEEKSRRLGTLDQEITQTQRICDVVISNDGSLDSAANGVRHFMK